MVGQSDTGKTDIKGILDGEIPALAMQRDYHMAYSSTKDSKLQAIPYKELQDYETSFPDMTPKQTIVIFDDPPPNPNKMRNFKDCINHLYINGRHKGYLPILCCQEISYLRKDSLGYVRSNCHLLIIPTAETRSMMKSLIQQSIITPEMEDLLFINPEPYMYNIIDRSKQDVYLLDRRSNPQREHLTKL